MNTIDYLLIGGYAATKAATAIRERDKEGSIVLLTREGHLPYERPPLSKELLFEDNFDVENAYTQLPEFYEKHSIEVRTGANVQSIDRSAKTIQLESGENLGYKKLFLAPGAAAKAPDVPGADFENVYTLRKLEDAMSIRTAIDTQKRVAIIGGSYLGLEVASGCLQKGLDVTVIDSHPGPWAKFSSRPLQEFVTKQFEGAGAKFVFNQRVEKIEGEGDATKKTSKATSVSTPSAQIPCDFVVAATGSKLNLDLAKAAGLDIDEKLGIIVDGSYQTSDPHIWSAGDAVHYPDPVVGKMWHNEHYINAQWSGEIAGANMVGEAKRLEHAPYFFSDFLDFRMFMRGNPGGGKSARVLGDMNSGEFIELYADENRVLKMAVGISRDAAKNKADAEKMEKLILAAPKVDDVTPEEFGL